MALRSTLRLIRLRVGFIATALAVLFVFAGGSAIAQVPPIIPPTCAPGPVICGSTPAPTASSIPQALPANPNQAIDTILTRIASLSATWTTNAQKIALSLFGLLAAIDIAYAAIQWALKATDISEFVGQILPKILSLGFFAGLIVNAPVWIPAIINSFVCAGMQIGGGGGACAAAAGNSLVTQVSPGQTFLIGLNLAAGMVMSPNLLDIVANPGAVALALLSGICALLVVVAFAIIAAQLLVAIVEAYFVLGGGMIMLGFTGSRWTVGFGEKYIGYAVSMGVKLMTLELVISFGDDVVKQVASMANLAYTGAAGGTGKFLAGSLGPSGGSSTFVGNIPTYLAMVGLIGIFMYLAWHIPQSAATLLNGSPTMSLAGVANAGMSAAFGAAAMGAAIAGGGLAAAGALKGGGLAAALDTSSAALPLGSPGDQKGESTQDLGVAKPAGASAGGGAGGNSSVFPEMMPSQTLALTGGGGGGGGNYGGGGGGGGDYGGGTSNSRGPQPGGGGGFDRGNPDRPNPTDARSATSTVGQSPNGSTNATSPSPQAQSGGAANGRADGGADSSRPFADQPGSGTGGEGASDPFFESMEQGGGGAAGDAPLATAGSSTMPAPWETFASGTTGGAGSQENGTGTNSSDGRSAATNTDDVIDAQFSEYDPSQDAPVHSAEPDVTEHAGQGGGTTAGMTATELATAIAQAIKPPPPTNMDKAKNFLKGVQRARKPNLVHDGGSSGSAPVRLSH